MTHLVGHLKKTFFTKAQSNARYADAVAGTDKAKNADKRDGRDAASFADAAHGHDTIRSGETVRGAFGAYGLVATSTSDFMMLNESLPREAPANLTDATVVVNGTAEDTDKCNGGSFQPSQQTAAPGYLCIFWNNAIGVDTSTFGATPSPCCGDTKLGFRLFWKASGTPSATSPVRTGVLAKYVYTAP